MVDLFINTPKSPGRSVATKSIRSISSKNEVRVALADSLGWGKEIIYSPSQSCIRLRRQGHRGIKVPLPFTEGINFVMLQVPVMCFSKLDWKRESLWLVHKDELVTSFWWGKSDLHGFTLSEGYCHVETVWCKTQKIYFLLRLKHRLHEMCLEPKVGRQTNSIHYITFTWIKKLTNEKGIINMPHASMRNRTQVCINRLEDFGTNPWGRGQAVREECILVVLSFPFKHREFPILLCYGAWIVCVFKTGRRHKVSRSNKLEGCS